MRLPAGTGMRLASAPPSGLLEAATLIGHDLCRRAYWDREGHLCNWMGRSLAEAGSAGDMITPTASALGFNLYEGTAGIALFLAQLHDATGELEFGRVAIAAIDRSIRHLNRAPAGSFFPLSFLGGALGVAFAARRVGLLLAEARLIDLAETLLERAAGAVDAPHPIDVIGGNAGAIPALLVSGSGVGPRVAIALGEELCRSAIRLGPIWTWDDDSTSGHGRGSVFLTGLAHGAAGIGLALLELHAATGRAEFLEGALGAFAYEDSLFDPKRSNWPDLRSFDKFPEATRTLPFAMGWCHGAPGIALSRLRATSIDRDRASSHLATARVAIESTIAGIAEALAKSRHDATPCHGLAGLGEVALIAGEALGDDVYRARAFELGRVLIDRHSSAGDWPSGLISGAFNPSLMIGTAGIGYWFLRLLDPKAVPSLLLLGT